MKQQQAIKKNTIYTKTVIPEENLPSKTMHQNDKSENHL
jgi:hypothetical protein